MISTESRTGHTEHRPFGVKYFWGKFGCENFRPRVCAHFSFLNFSWRNPSSIQLFRLIIRRLVTSACLGSWRHSLNFVLNHYIQCQPEGSHVFDYGLARESNRIWRCILLSASILILFSKGLNPDFRTSRSCSPGGTDISHTLTSRTRPSRARSHAIGSISSQSSPYPP